MKLNFLLVVSLFPLVASYLYNDQTKLHMHNLDSDSADIVLLNATEPTIWLVQFYSHWCGSCQNFVPKWVRIVQNVQHWSPIVKTAAIDCAANTETCRKFQVKGYPTIRCYWPAVTGTEYHDFYNLLPFSYREIISRIGKAVVSLVNNPANKPKIPPLTKYLLPSVLGTDEFWHFHDSSIEHLFVIESETDIKQTGAVGAQVCLNTTSLYVSGRLDVKYTVINKNAADNIHYFLYAYLKFTAPIAVHLPMLLKLDPSSKKAKNILGMGVDPIKAYFFAFEDLKEEVLNLKTPVLPHIISSKRHLNPVWLPEDDLYGCVHHFLFHEVPLNRHVNKTQMADLVEFLSVIVEYVPFQSTAVTEALQRIYMDLSNKNAPLEMPIKQWTKLIRDADMPPPRPWNHCKGSKPYFRGYPCSLWLLFHTITANAALKHDAFEISTTFPAIRGFVRSFFGCGDCRHHFANATKKYSDVPNSEAHFILWKMHNIVNKRLAGAVSEDPESPKIQYPSEGLCPECYKDGNDYSPGTWNYNAVESFLRRHFSPKAIIPLSEHDESSKFESRPMEGYVFKTN